MRTEKNYNEQLYLNRPDLTGIVGPSVLSDLKSISKIDLLTADIMHDMFEGVCEYDFGMVLLNFIEEKKYFNYDFLNSRISEYYYGLDELRNKPKNISQAQEKNKKVKMSASESLCLLRNIGVLIGDKVPD